MERFTGTHKKNILTGIDGYILGSEFLWNRTLSFDYVLCDIKMFSLVLPCKNFLV